MLYSQKKGQLSVKYYMAKEKQMCDVLTIAGNEVFEQEQVNVVLAGLPVEYESVRVVASAINISLEFFT